MTITEFLLARIAEDEYLAQTCLLPENLIPYGDERIPAIEPSEWGNLARNYLGGEMGEHCAQQNPMRTIAECAAKRAIIEWSNICFTDSEALGHLAAVYKDHPDYQQEWA